MSHILISRIQEISFESPLSVSECNKRLIESETDSQLTDEEAEGSYSISEFRLRGRRYMIFSKTERPKSLLNPGKTYPFSASTRHRQIVRLDLLSFSHGTRITLRFYVIQYFVPLAVVVALAAAFLANVVPAYIAIPVMAVLVVVLAMIGFVYEDNPEYRSEFLDWLKIVLSANP